MASSNAKKNETQRPPQLKASKSFSKAEPASPARSSRNQRASTIHNGGGGVVDGPLSNKTNTSNDKPPPKMQSDVFENDPDGENTKQPEQSGSKPLAASEELPIELVSLTDRCDLSLPLWLLWF